jgi:hypothetical protein
VIDVLNEEVEEKPDKSAGQADSAERLESQRRELLNAIASSKLTTVEHRVAWILNNYPDTRNSDIALQIAYWETFHGGEFRPDALTYDDLHRLPRLTSLTRARARVQNTLKLFLADEAVRRHRGTLSEEERDHARKEKAASYPVYAVYIDESGKTQHKILVGSLWILQGPETLRIAISLEDWRDKTGFRDEIHFADVGRKNLVRYMEAIDIVLANAAALGFKYVAVPRSGAGQQQDVVAKLMYHLLVEGVQHEHDSGRAPLPRNLQVWKDAEEPGYDKVVLADAKDRLENAAASRFEGRLVVDVLEAAESKSNDLLQIADLFTASVNRIINPPEPRPKEPGPKDELAQYVLAGLKLRPAEHQEVDDLAVEIVL